MHKATSESPFRVSPSPPPLSSLKDVGRCCIFKSSPNLNGQLPQISCELDEVIMLVVTAAWRRRTRVALAAHGNSITSRGVGRPARDAEAVVHLLLRRQLPGLRVGALLAFRLSGTPTAAATESSSAAARPAGYRRRTAAAPSSGVASGRPHRADLRRRQIGYRTAWPRRRPSSRRDSPLLTTRRVLWPTSRRRTEPIVLFLLLADGVGVPDGLEAHGLPVGFIRDLAALHADLVVGDQRAVRVGDLRQITNEGIPYGDLPSRPAA